MRVSLLLLMAVAASGCGLEKVAVPIDDGPKTVEVRKMNLTDDQKIALLRVEARKRGLKWRVFCSPSAHSEDTFTAWAVKKGEPFQVYAEDGAGASWWVFSAPSQADAAFALYQSIQGEPDAPMHRPKPNLSEEHKHYCPPELRGE